MPVPYSAASDAIDEYSRRRGDREAAIISNDLDSLVHRIEMLQAHPHYTTALASVLAAKKAIDDGRSEIHHESLKKRHAS